MEGPMAHDFPEIPEAFNLADYYLDARVREGLGDKVAILFGEERWTYAQVQAAANRMAHVLRAAGVRVEDRVLISLPDGPLFAATFFAVLKCGAVVAMVNPELPPEDYAYYLEYTRARAFVCDLTLAESLRSTIEHARHLDVCLARGGGLEDALADAPDTFDNEPTSRDDVAIWLFTSGSTGKPKAAVHCHADFAFNTERYAKHVLGLRRDDVTLSVPKLFFGYATGSNLMFPFAVGATTILYAERPTPERLFELAARHRPTMLTTVPTMIGKMLAHAEERADRPKLDSLRFSISAGEALPEELYRRWKAAYGSEILDGIGSAELFHIYITNRLGDVKPGSLGKLVPGYDAKICDDDGNPLPDGTIGTLWVRGASAALWYFGARAKSFQTFRGDWVVSGDKFTRDADGYFYYAGRADDLLKVGGIFVAPLEVENVILEHPAVLECCVVGYEDDEKLVKAKAVVVKKPSAALSDGALADEIVALCRQRLVHYKVPRRVEYVAALPRSDRGKILRAQVR